LNAAEARALFLVAGPASSATPELRAALRKLVRALPESFRTEAEAATTSVLVDPRGWDEQAQRRAPEHLDAVQQAVVRAKQVVLGYVARDRAASTRVVHPLGLAAKGSTWYLVADTEAGLRTFRVDRIQSVELTDDDVVRPDGFELEHAWKLIADEVDRRRTPLTAVARARPDSLPLLRWILGTRVRIGPPEDDGTVTVELRGHNVQSLAGQLAGAGGAIEVLEPQALREELARIGSELSATYQ
jgi:predicted DNA-binding transcriptional regulator YafY